MHSLHFHFVCNTRSKKPLIRSRWNFTWTFAMLRCGDWVSYIHSFIYISISMHNICILYIFYLSVPLVLKYYWSNRDEILNWPMLYWGAEIYLNKIGSVAYSPVSNCRGGSITKFSIFSLRLQFITTPPICEDFEKVRPP